MFYLVIHIPKDLEECQSDRHKKYVELRKREETIESFLSSYGNTKDTEMENLKRLKREIVNIMFTMSKHLLTLPPTENEYDLVNTELNQIDSDEPNDQKSLLMQYKQKQLYLEKVGSCYILRFPATFILFLF